MKDKGVDRGNKDGKWIQRKQRQCRKQKRNSKCCIEY